MKTFIIHLRTGKCVSIVADHYTEVEKEGRTYFYFHSDPKGLDKESFFGLRDIEGIETGEAPKPIPSMDEILKDPKMEHILREYLKIIDERKSQTNLTERKNEPNEALEPMRLLVTESAFSSLREGTFRAKQPHGSV